MGRGWIVRGRCTEGGGRGLSFWRLTTGREGIGSGGGGVERSEERKKLSSVARREKKRLLVRRGLFRNGAVTESESGTGVGDWPMGDEVRTCE